MKLADLLKYDQIVIQAHNNPDADAVGSGYALYRYFRLHGKDVRLVYGGRNAVSKSNMKLMISELEIPIEHVQELEPPELLLTVDCQYGEGNVQKFEARNVAMIDHHATGRESDGSAEIRSQLVSCATLCYSMLSAEGFDMNSDIRIATALFYGLYMDSSQLSEIDHPLDRDMIDFLHYDKTLITRLKYANYSLSELDTTGYAISHNRYVPEKRLSIVRSKPCDPNILGVIGDLVIQVDSIDVCVVYNEYSDGYKLSVRSCTPESAANEFAAFLTCGIGNGGGHFDKAGGFISARRFSDRFGGRDIEDYLLERAEEYFGNFDMIRYTDEISSPELLQRYRKKPAVYGYVRSCDLFSEGAQIRIRTLEGDVQVRCRENIYIMIGGEGEVYPVEKEILETKYDPSETRFEAEFEYPPSVTDMSDNSTCSLMEHALSCASRTDAIVYARPLEKYTKVFTAWDYETYMAGEKGDMLCYTGGNSRDVYIVKQALFDKIYEKCDS